MITTSIYKTSLGELILGSHQGHLCLCDWRYRKKRDAIDARISLSLDSAFVEGESEVIERAKEQLGEYLLQERKVFDLPLYLPGSDFQQRIWRELVKIPFGKTTTYMNLAKELGDEKAIRAVAAANGANAVSIIVPCHRVIGSDGSLTGYAGGLQVKKNLLKLENALPQQELNFY